MKRVGSDLPKEFSKQMPKNKMEKKNSLSLLSIHDDIVKSPSDSRVYHGFQLTNKLKVVVISDPTSEKAAASMDVHIGSFKDPFEIPGLAHFCEHMLFMGTEKYPDEELYGKFITQNAGMCNAYTSGDHTNYYFDIKHDKLEEILDQFSQFFISPTFNEDSTSREVKAVHSEHEKNVMSDYWRADSVDKAVCNQTHDYAKFGTGDRYTLMEDPLKKGIQVRDELLKFHAKYYSSNIMTLAVLGSQPVEELKRIVVDKFTGIVNKEVEIPKYSEGPYLDEHLKIRIDIVPVKETRYITLRFPIPDFQKYYTTKPGEYASHLIGHEGEGSLLSSLKDLGYVDELSAGCEEEANGFDFFDITCDLTEDGIEHIEETVYIIFQYINMLRSSKPSEKIFLEMRDIENMDFRFQEKKKPSDLVVNIAEHLHYYPISEVLSAPKLVSKFDSELIENFLSYLVPKNVRLTVCANELEESCNTIEKWYKCKYNVTKLSDDLIKKWSEAPRHEDHALPSPNEFIATDFEIKSPPSNFKRNKHPFLISKTDMSRVWFKQDTTFNLPKSILKFYIMSPESYSTPDCVNMSGLFVELLKDSLNEYAYDADIAGLSYSLSDSFYGVMLEVNGYNEKQKVFLEKIVNKIVNFEVDAKRFKIYKQKAVRKLKNFKAAQPYGHTSFYGSALKTDRWWLKHELADSLKNITYKQLQSFINNVYLSQLFIESLMIGNLTAKDALTISTTIEKMFKEKCNSRACESNNQLREVAVGEGNSYVYKTKHEVRDISACEVCLQIGGQTDEINVMSMLLVQIIDDPCFDILRTKEQLGYIVSASYSKSQGRMNIKFLIQSTKSPDYLDGRIEAFIHNINEILEKLNEAEFSEHVESLKTTITEKPKKLAHEFADYWTDILTKQYDFSSNEREAAFLEGVTKDDVINFYNKYVKVDAPNRAKLAVYVLGKDINSCQFAPGDISNIDSSYIVTPPIPTQPELIESIEAYKKGRKVYPRKLAAIDVNTPTL